MKKTMMLTTALAAVLVLAGCGGEDASGPEKTVTQTVAPAPEPEPAPAPTASEHPILAAAWDQQTAEDQYNMCFGWGYDRETMIDTFFAEAGGSLNITRTDVIEFFDGKCG